MHNLFKSFKRALTPTLSAEERMHMRKAFHEYMDAHAPRPSPYATAFRLSGLYAIVAILVVSGPLLYAAERSLPNDVLYSLKTKVVEPTVIAVVSFSDSAEIEAHTAIVGRRLSEAERLAVQKELTAENAVLLQDGVERSVRKAHASVEAFRLNGNLEDALDAVSELENVLEAHGDALKTIASRDTSPSDDELIKSVESFGEETEDIGEDLEEGLAKDLDVNAYVAEISEDTEETIAEFKEQLRAHEVVAPDVAELVENAEEAYAEGVVHQEAGESDEALSDIRDALKSAKRGTILHEAYKEIEDSSE